MGTNYYAIPKVNEGLKIEMKRLVDAEDFRTLETFIPNEVHIGKQSGGWRFIFNHNGEVFYKKNRESINEFLERCNIKNEYGKEVSLSEFWETVDSSKKWEPDIQYGFMSDDLNFSYSDEFS